MIDWSRIVIGPTIAAFGMPVRFQPAYGKPGNVRGVFDEAYTELTPLGRGGIDTESAAFGSQGAISTTTPVLGVRLDEFPQEPKQSDVLIIEGRRFVIKEVRPDGHGGAKLMLNEID